MTVLAYSAVANPFQISQTGEQNFNLSANGTRTYTINVNSNGILLAFLVIINVRVNDVQSGVFLITIKKNGTVISNVSPDLNQFRISPTAGILYYETLGFLSGSEVQSGDTFTLDLTCSSISTSVTLDANMSLFVKNQGKVYDAF